MTKSWAEMISRVHDCFRSSRRPVVKPRGRKKNLCLWNAVTIIVAYLQGSVRFWCNFFLCCYVRPALRRPSKMFSAPNRPLSLRYNADAANGMSSYR